VILYRSRVYNDSNGKSALCFPEGVKRKRKLDTEAIFKYLVKGSILNTGISTCINLDNDFSHVAMIKARRKLQENLRLTVQY